MQYISWTKWTNKEIMILNINNFLFRVSRNMAIILLVIYVQSMLICKFVSYKELLLECSKWLLIRYLRLISLEASKILPCFIKVCILWKRWQTILYLLRTLWINYSEKSNTSKLPFSVVKLKFAYRYKNMKTECLQKGVQCTVCQDHFGEFFCLILWNSGSVAMTTICTKPLEKK